MKKAYTTPQLFVHGSVQEMTLGVDPKPYIGNDGLGCGAGQGSDDPAWTPPDKCS